jgi:hypothetical protein
MSESSSNCRTGLASGTSTDGVNDDQDGALLLFKSNIYILSGGDREIVEAPAFKNLKSEQKGTRLPSNGEKASKVKAGSVK